MAVSFLLAARSRFSVFCAGDHRLAARQNGEGILARIGVRSTGSARPVFLLVLRLVIVVECPQEGIEHEDEPENHDEAGAELLEPRPFLRILESSRR